MGTHAQPLTDAGLAATLHARGRRATSQRLILHRALRELDRHTTADDLLRATADRLPNLSLPTVYATLELYEDLGLVRRVPVGSGPVLWDPRPDPHQHFACRSCGRVVDLDAPARAGPVLAAARAAGHAPDSAQVVVVGLCRGCARGKAHV
jgi:Fur family transcriptional regulator, stress-responsive regulator